MSEAVRARWFPATVRLPDEPRPWRQVYVLLVDGGDRAGLHVFRRPGEDAQWSAAVDWARTELPARERDARNGVDVHLADGRLVVVTAGQGCRCGALGRWAGPSWASRVRAGAR